MKIRLITLFLTCFMAQSMTAQLTSLGLVEESNITNVDKEGYMNFIPELSFTEDYLYVATPKGLYRCLYESNPEWEKLPLTDELVLDFEVRGDTLIVLTRGQLLYSSDGGKNARKDSVTNEISDISNSRLLGMAVHPHDATHIFVATNGAGLWQTHDAGSEWAKICNNNGCQVALTRLFFNPHNALHLIGLYNNPILDSGELLFSHDGGSQWKYGGGEYAGSNILQALNMSFHPEIENKIVACGHSLYAISDDAGASWTAIKESNGRDCVANITDVQFDTRNVNVLYGADWFISKSNTTTVVRSTDGGYTWDEFFSESVVPNAHVLSLDMKDNFLALYTYAGGIYLLDVDAVDTAISPVVNGEGAAPYYDLMGRKVARPTRGIYIREGRKVVIE